METGPSRSPTKRSPFPRLLPLLLVFLLLLSGVIVVTLQQRQTHLIACTEEAKQCPDGSYVGRTGPQCEFAPCPTMKASPTNVQLSITAAPTLLPTPTGSLSTACCSKTQLRQGYECLPNCGPPLARKDDDTQTYSCLSPDEAKNRKYYGCPICLSSDTLIDTPLGERNVKSLQVGDYVYSQDKSGKRITVPIVQTFMAKAGSSHPIIHLVLSDNRELWVSPYHPLKNGQAVSKLRVGQYYDNAIVRKVDLVAYTGTSTYDILPKGDTGLYWANNILVGSTLKK